MGETRLNEYANPASVASTQWLANHLGDPTVQPVEVGWEGSAYGSDYPSAHIPGAAYWDLYRDLQHPVRRDVLEKPMLEALLCDTGIGTNTTVVLYSGRANLLSAYAFWLLKLYGHLYVRLLDGGRETWVEEGRPMTAEVPAKPPTEYSAPPPDWSLRAGRDLVAQYIGSQARILVDLRPPEMFHGPDTGRTERAGHIPGAINVPARMTRGAQGKLSSLRLPSLQEDGTFLPASELRALFDSHGVTPDKEIIVYCMRAGLSTHAWFVLTQLLGHPHVREYDGSWAEWGNLIGAPMER